MCVQVICGHKFSMNKCYHLNCDCQACVLRNCIHVTCCLLYGCFTCFSLSLSLSLILLLVLYIFFFFCNICHACCFSSPTLYLSQHKLSPPSHTHTYTPNTRCCPFTVTLASSFHLSSCHLLHHHLHELFVSAQHNTALDISTTTSTESASQVSLSLSLSLSFSIDNESNR